MSTTADPVAAEALVTVYRKFDDGYIVRSMTPADAVIVQRWYSGMGINSRYDLDTCLKAFPASLRGFYIGELDGNVVASAVRLPWGDDIYYGSSYYVEKQYRGKGYGTRLRDQVAFEHVGGKKLAVDAVLGKVAQTNAEKFGYKEAFKTGRFAGTAKKSYELSKNATTIVTADQVPFEKIIDYDNKCFVSRNCATRREFLRLWTQVPGGATYVALSGHGGHVIGYGSRRPAIQTGNHMVGPLYADSREVAEAILARLCTDVSGDKVTINIWYPNENAVSLLRQFEFSNVFDVLRMHVNGDPEEYKQQVYALTSIDMCGF